MKMKGIQESIIPKIIKFFIIRYQQNNSHSLHLVYAWLAGDLIQKEFTDFLEIDF